MLPVPPQSIILLTHVLQLEKAFLMSHSTSQSSSLTYYKEFQYLQLTGGPAYHYIYYIEGNLI